MKNVLAVLFASFLFGVSAFAAETDGIDPMVASEVVALEVEFSREKKSIAQLRNKIIEVKIEIEKGEERAYSLRGDIEEIEFLIVARAQQRPRRSTKTTKPPAQGPKRKEPMSIVKEEQRYEEALEGVVFREF